MAIRVYTSQHCGPCKSLKALIEQGKIKEDIEIVDIETDEGFEKFSKEVLEKSDGAVPSAYRDGQQCRILVDEETSEVSFECPDAPPASPPG